MYPSCWLDQLSAVTRVIKCYFRTILEDSTLIERMSNIYPMLAEIISSYIHYIVCGAIDNVIVVCIGDSDTLIINYIVQCSTNVTID